MSLPPHLDLDLERAKQVDHILREVLETPPERRRSVLEELCRGDGELLELAEEMLGDAHATETRLRSGGALEAGLMPSVAPAVARIDRYRLLRQLGQGGMGVVYLAERDDGAFEQQVALKLLAWGLESQALRRFERERQILARLEHPNIARLIDGGTSGQGLPFLVMELVEGLPIDEHCLALDLLLSERVRLLMTICRAVQAAHGQLIVHRDLKPSNILVAGEDRRVKLLDFGIARILEGDGMPGEEPTRTVSRLMTPQYASPEQVLGRPVGVTSDVYQLGLLAYELVAGRRPYDVQRTDTPSALRMICETQPSPPSEVWRSKTGSPQRPGADLDQIILKALRKDPERRYATVDQLRLDLERFLQGRPVSARPLSATYRVGRFLKRHRFAAGLVASALVLFLALGAAFTWRLASERDQTQMALEQAQQERLLAERRQRESEAVTQFLSRLFESTDPFGLGSEHSELRPLDLLEKGAKTLETELSEEPQTRAVLLYQVGSILSRQDRYEVAVPMLEESVMLLREAPVERRADLADAMRILGNVYLTLGRPESLELLEESLEVLIKVHGPNDGKVIQTRLDLARLLFDRGNFEGAVAALEVAVEALDESPHASPSLIGQALVGYGASLQELGRFDEAQLKFEEARRRTEGVLPEDHPLSAVIEMNIGVILVSRGRFEESLGPFQEAIEMHGRSLGREHFMVAQALYALGSVQLKLEDFEEAEKNLNESLEYLSRTFEPGHKMIVPVQLNLAQLKQEIDQPWVAEELARSVLTTGQLPEEHPERIYAYLRLGAALLAQGRVEEAGPPLRRSHEAFEEGDGLGRFNVHIGENLMELAKLAHAEKRPAEAERFYQAALEAERGVPGSDESGLEKLRASYERFTRELADGSFSKVDREP